MKLKRVVMTRWLPAGLALIVLVPVIAFAIHAYLPEQNHIFLEIARSGHGNTLQAPSDYVKLAYDNAPSYIQFFDGAYCKPSNYDTNGDPYTPDSCSGYETGTDTTSIPGQSISYADEERVYYQFWGLNNENGRFLGCHNRQKVGGVSSGAPLPNSSMPADFTIQAKDLNANVWDKLTLPNSGSTKICTKNNDTDGRHFVVMRAIFDRTDKGIGGVNAYKILLGAPDGSGPGAGAVEGTRQGYATYDSTDYVQGTDYPLVVQHRPLAASTGTTDDGITFEFAPGCDIQTPTRAAIKWFDADYGGGAQPSSENLKWVLWDDGPKGAGAPYPKRVKTVVVGGVQRFAEVSGTADGYDAGGARVAIGGSGDAQSFRVDFDAAHRYRMVWDNLDTHNGIQITLPFDSYNYVRGCPELQASIGGDQTIDVSTTSTVTGTAFIRNKGDADERDDAHLEVAEAKTSDTTAPYTVIAPSGYISNEDIDTSEVSPSVSGVGGGWGGSDCAGHRAQSTDTETPACVTSHWRWHFNPSDTLPANSGWIAKHYIFTVSSAIPDNTKLCFVAYASPEVDKNSSTNYDSSDSLQCFTFKNPRFPGLAVHGGDTHAGGFTTASCSTTAAGGSISANANSGSFGDYVVSAGGSINKFGSAGADGAANTSLLFGYNPSSGLGGFYANLCRPDLGSAVADFGAVGGAIGNEASDIANHPNQVIQYTGTVHLGNLSITKPVTIWVSNGDLYLDGNITPGAAYSPGGPAFGVVVTNGRIFINKSVSDLFGYFYQAKPGDATSGIYTCYNYSNQVSDCSSTLNLYGFMSADNFHFQRLGTASNTYGEILNPSNFGYDFSSLLINPPPAFTNSAFQNQKGTLFDGERPPLY